MKSLSYFSPLSIKRSPIARFCAVKDVPVAKRTIVLDGLTYLRLRFYGDWRYTKLFDKLQSTRAQSDIFLATLMIKIMRDTLLVEAATQSDCPLKPTFIWSLFNSLDIFGSVGCSAFANLTIFRGYSRYFHCAATWNPRLFALFGRRTFNSHTRMRH